MWKKCGREEVWVYMWIDRPVDVTCGCELSVGVRKSKCVRARGICR